MFLLQTFPEAIHAVQSMAESVNDKAVQSGLWVGICSPDIMKAFTQRSVHDRLKSSKFPILS